MLDFAFVLTNYEAVEPDPLEIADPSTPTGGSARLLTGNLGFRF